VIGTASKKIIQHQDHTCKWGMMMILTLNYKTQNCKQEKNRKRRKERQKKTCSCCGIIGSLWTAKVLFNLQRSTSSSSSSSCGWRHFCSLSNWAVASSQIGSFCLSSSGFQEERPREKKVQKKSTRSSCRLSIAAAEESSLKELSILDYWSIVVFVAAS